MHVAAITGDLAALQSLRSAWPSWGYNRPDYCGSTPLLLACEHGHSEVARYLLSMGARPCCPRISGDSALHMAAYNLLVPDVLERLVELGAPINGGGFCQQTALMYASRGGSPHEQRRSRSDVIQSLVHIGADVNAADEAGRGSLAHAVMGGHLAAVTELLRHGARPGGTADCTGRDTVWMACTESDDLMLEVLLDAGASPMRANHEYDSTPLHFAAGNGLHRICSILLEYGACPNATDVAGSTPLIHAAARGDVQMVRALMFAGGIIEAMGPYGLTVLDAAALSGHVACAALLRRAMYWAPIHRACEARCSVAHMREMLRSGHDPHELTFAGQSPLAILGTDDVAQGCLPRDPALLRLVAAACLPWHQRRAHLFPRSLDRTLLAILSIPASGGGPRPHQVPLSVWVDVIIPMTVGRPARRLS